MVAAAGAVDRVLLASYTPEAMDRVRATEPNVATCYDEDTGMGLLAALLIAGSVWENYVPTDDCLSMDTGDVTYYGLTDEQINAVRTKGIRFQIHTLNSTFFMLDWMERCADGILTDPPDLLSGAIATWLSPMGAVGDDLTDEYETSPDGGTGLNWIEHLVANRAMNFGTSSATSRGEPRRAGYEYNWARVGATTDALLTQGQHTGLAGQVSTDSVHLAYLAAGLNDFAPPTVHPTGKYREIYEGAWAGQDLDDVLDALEADLATAMDTLLSASPGVKMVVATIPDFGHSPYVLQGWAYDYSDPVKRQRVTDAIQAANGRIVTLAADRSVPVADLFAAVEEIFSAGSLTFAGVPIDLYTADDDPDHFYCADGIHPGTVAQGIFANRFVNALNVYGTDVALLTEEEIWPGLYCTLTITAVNGQWGQVQLDPEPNDANQPTYEVGTVITLTAVPMEGRVFAEWRIYDPNRPGDANYVTTDTNDTLAIAMNDDYEIDAVFRCGSSVRNAFPYLLIAATCSLISRRARCHWLRQSAK